MTNISRHIDEQGHVILLNNINHEQKQYLEREGENQTYISVRSDKQCSINVWCFYDHQTIQQDANTVVEKLECNWKNSNSERKETRNYEANYW